MQDASASPCFLLKIHDKRVSRKMTKQRQNTTEQSHSWIYRDMKKTRKQARDNQNRAWENKTPSKHKAHNQVRNLRPSPCGWVPTLWTAPRRPGPPSVREKGARNPTGASGANGLKTKASDQQHKGAKHHKNDGTDDPWAQYYLSATINKRILINFLNKTKKNTSE